MIGYNKISNVTYQGIWKTTNLGSNWTFATVGTTSADSVAPLNSIVFADDNTGLAIRSDYSVWKSTNGGINWTKMSDLPKAGGGASFVPGTTQAYIQGPYSMVTQLDYSSGTMQTALLDTTTRLNAYHPYFSSASRGFLMIYSGNGSYFSTVNVTANPATVPVVSSFSPSGGAIGTSVTIIGTNFGSTQGTSVVKFGTATAIPTSWSNAQIVVPVPSGVSGSVAITVTVNSQVASSLSNFDASGSVTPPTAPVAQQATNITSTGFTAVWNSSSNATDYRLDVSADINFSNFLSGYADLSVGNVTSYDVTGLSESTTYYYRVRAVGTGGTSTNSNVISVITSAQVSGPTINHTAYSSEVTVSSGTIPSSVTITASATDANVVSAMYLQYRQVSNTVYTSLVFNSPYQNNQSVQIPGSTFVDNGKGIGVDYRIVATNSLGISNATQWYSITVRNGSGIIIQPGFTMPIVGSASTTEEIQKAYRIFSVPCNLDDHKANFVFNSLGDHSKDAVRYTNWRLQRIVGGAKQDYEDFKDQAVVYPGTGFFLIIRNSGSTINFEASQHPSTLVKAADMYNVGVDIAAGAQINGWFLLGTPMNINIQWDSLVFVGATPVDHAKYTGTGSVNGWDKSINQLTPWEGLAVKISPSGTQCTVKFKTGISGSLPKQGITPKMVRDEVQTIPASPNDWCVKVNAYRSDINMRCEGGGFGMRNGAKIDHDQFDTYLPPSVGEKAVMVGFTGTDGPRMMDVRPLDENGGVWDMKLTTIDAGVRVKLNFGGALNLPNPTFEVYLIDLDEKIAYNLKTTTSLEVGSGDGSKNFRVVAGKKAFVNENNAGVDLHPATMNLYPNYPNPFNPSTTIRYTVPNTSEMYNVTLKIFNVLGQEIATLINDHQKSGYYEVTWNALQQSSGIYFYQLSITDGSKTFQDIKKMVLMK
jgi:hypothetical protein